MINQTEELKDRKREIMVSLSRLASIFEEVQRGYIQTGYAIDNHFRLHRLISEDDNADANFTDSEFDAIDKFATQLRILFESKDYQTLSNILRKYDR